ncbi:MAG: TonB-dependent receptor [Acidobacteria bacterium]|nr:TonB-dependent receptor [Acidobacteriota bacterium]
MRSLHVVVFCAFVSLVSSNGAWAQATAELNGRVTDGSDAVLPGVSVTAQQTDTGFVRTVVTDSAGSWVMPNLPTGPYRLEVSLQGFRTYVQTGIVLQVDARPTINASLAVGSIEETVSVEAAAPIVDVRSAGISAVVDQERIVELPLQGRQVTDLIMLAGAAVETGRPNSRNFQGGVNISVAGGLQFGVAYTLDGAVHNDPQNSASLPLPFPDALQEFRVATSGLAAQSGMRSGASVNAVTKSGTNAIHGNGFEFVRDKRFNATSPFAAIGPDGKRFDDGLKRHQFGATVGGPIVRDRLFYFAAYQGTRTRQTPPDLIAFVPTAAMLAGDFTTFASPQCQGRQVTLGAGFAGNRIDPARFSPAALKMVTYLPKTDDPCGQITYSQPDDRDEGQYVGRVDFQLTNNHTIFGRYMATRDKKPAAYGTTGNVLTTVNPSIDNMAQSLTLGDTTVFGNNMVNALRFAFNRTAVNRDNDPYFDPPKLGIKATSYVPDTMIVVVTGGFQIAAATATRGLADNNSFQFNDDLTLVRGNHQIALGASVAHFRVSFRTWARGGGQWNFTGAASGLGLADLLLGRVNTVDQSGLSGVDYYQWYHGSYIQDTWRASSRITVNTGLRWEPFFSQNLTRGANTIFDRDLFRTNVKSAQFLNAPAGFIYPGDKGFPPGTAGLNKKWANFSPRAGVAWDVQGDGRLAVRSSYALTYDYPGGEYFNNLAAAPPYGNRTLISDPAGLLDDPYRDIGGNPHPIEVGPNTQYPVGGTLSSMDPDINSPRVQSWNVSVERQLGLDWGVSASYLGSYSDRLWGLVALNPGVYLGTGACVIQGVSYPVCSTNANLNQRRELSISGENPASARLISNLDSHAAVGTQKYRGLKLTMQRRSGSGLNINANYTLSRCEGLEMVPNAQFGIGYVNPADPFYDYGHCDGDRTHLANGTVSYMTPEIANRALDILASSWRLSGIVNARSGNWMTILSGRDSAFNGQANQRVDQISDDVYGEKSLTAYLNRNAFAQPANGAFGTSERNSVEGPGFWKIDLAVTRLVPVISTHTLELRVEVFNLLNNFNWGNPNLNYSAGTFGRITTLGGDPRIMQFGVKYAF